MNHVALFFGAALGLFVLSSAGVGMRFTAWSHWDGTLDLAWPFHDSGDIEAGEERLHFRVAYEF